MMENDPIFCFQHCQAEVNILCCDLPDNCPICSQDVYQTPLKIPPFRLPSPFVDSTDTPYSVVIKPTNGTFLGDYENEADLHIGITDSRGVVYHYNEHGVNRSEDGWTQCLSTPITNRERHDVMSIWDSKLIEFSAYDRWTSSNYSEQSSNCYTFALAFLELVQEYCSLNLPCSLTKVDFSKGMVLPQTVQAAKYIGLYRTIARDGVLVQYNTTL